MIVFCAFTFDPEAAKDIDALKGITALKAQMNTDLLTEDLKKARSSNQSFWLMGQPDVRGDALARWTWRRVEVHGFDYFDTVKGELVSGGKAQDRRCGQLDTDYDERSLFPHQVFFPMAGKDEGWMKLKKNIRAELDEGLAAWISSTARCRCPLRAGDNRKVAVKIVDDRGIESLKVMRLDGSDPCRVRPNDHAPVPHHQFAFRGPHPPLARENADSSLRAGWTCRRPAGYEIFDTRDNTLRSVELELVNRIRERVDAWRRGRLSGCDVCHAAVACALAGRGDRAGSTPSTSASSKPSRR
jgi:hypothetical protein